MARSAPLIVLESHSFEISYEEVSMCVAQASALLWAVKQRLQDRELSTPPVDNCVEDRSATLEEHQAPRPKVGML